MENKEITYKIKNVHISADSPADIQFPELKDRIIEKFGDVVEFSIAQIEAADQDMIRQRKELQAKHDYEKIYVDNIEQHHPFVKDLSEQDLLTIWMYKQAKGHVEHCAKEIQKLNDQLELDKKEIEEIYKQIPELGVKSADVIEGKVVIDSE